MEKDGDSVMGEVAKTSGIGFDGLDQRVKPLCSGVCDAVGEISEDILHVAFDGVGCGLQRSEFGTFGSPKPLLEKSASLTFAPAIPEGAELFFVRPRPSRLEVDIQEFGK